MNISEIEKGMHVTIGMDISKTHRFFNSDSYMRNMRGKVFPVAKVMDDRVEINNYVWHPEDLFPIEEEITEPKIFLFDPKCL